MPDELPLTSLLSQALIALTIEIDNEMERRLPHVTSRHGASGVGGPWLISLAMWADFLRHLGDGQLPVLEVYRRAGLDPRTVTGYLGLERWGYVLHRPDANDSRPKVPKKDWVVIPTTTGRRWHETYPDAIAAVEQRWSERHGVAAVAALRDALDARLAGARPMPQYLPVVRRDLRTIVATPEPPEPPRIGLVGMLARALMAITLDLEAALPVAMPIGGNVLRVVPDGGVLVRDLPRLTGTSKEAVSFMITPLERAGLARIEPDGKAKRLDLTDAGRAARAEYERVVGAVDDDALRAALAPIDVSPTPRYEGGGWRAQVKVPDTLPHHPVVLHRGGYPDGS